MPGQPNKISHFFQELRRRKVIHVIVAYATFAFVILEAVDIIFPRLNFPDWTVTFVMILLAIGFPLAIIFSWIFDYTPTGIVKTRHMDEIEKTHTPLENENISSEDNSLWSRVLPWSLIALVSATIVLLWIFRWNNEPAEQPLIKSVQVLPGDAVINGHDQGAAIAFSPDGRILIYAASINDTSFLYVKRMDEFEPRMQEGTEGAYAPFFSPDGNWVGFFADGKLKKVSILGGAPQVICDTYPGYEGSWGDDNSIVFCDYLKRGLWRVSADGGDPVQLTSAMTWSNAESEHSHYWPFMLPGGKSLLYTIYHNADDMSIAVFSLETGQRKILIQPGSHAAYIDTGHLVYAWKGDLWAVPFDIRHMEVVGEPVIILQDIMMNAVHGLAHFSLSGEGSIAFAPGVYKLPEDKMVLVDFEMNYEQLDFPPGRYQNPVFSQDGKELLITRLQEKASTWVYEMDRGTFRRFTDKDFESYWAIWAPDGNSIIYNSNRHGGDELNLFQKPLSSTGPVKQLTISEFNQQPKSWSGDGRKLIYLENVHTETGWDIYMIETDDGNSQLPLFNTRFNEAHPTLSPDGRWLAYVSDEPGQFEVFVSPFPSLDQRIQISNAGGTEPIWAPDGNTLYYRNYSGDQVMAVSLSNDFTLPPGKPRVILEGNFKQGYVFGRTYDLHPDGDRFLMIQTEEFEDEGNRINIIHNWSGELAGFFE